MSIHLFELNTTQSKSEKEYMSCVPYASVVNNLMYVTVCTRSSLVKAVSVVSRCVGNPRKEHWQVMKHIFRYLKGITDIELQIAISRVIQSQIQRILNVLPSFWDQRIHFCTQTKKIIHPSFPVGQIEEKMKINHIFTSPKFRVHPFQSKVWVPRLNELPLTFVSMFSSSKTKNANNQL